MARFAEDLGFQVDEQSGIEGSLDQEHMPIIVRMGEHGYAVVFLNTQESFLIYAPSLGYNTISNDVFYKKWDGQLLRIRPPPLVGDAK